jgi:hypothetical protein
MEGGLYLHEMPSTAEAPILEIAPVDREFAECRPPSKTRASQSETWARLDYPGSVVFKYGVEATLTHDLSFIQL